MDRYFRYNYTYGQWHEITKLQYDMFLVIGMKITYRTKVCRIEVL